MGKKDKGREGIFKRMRKAVYGVSKERERQGTVNFKEKEEEGRNRKFWGEQRGNQSFEGKELIDIGKEFNEKGEEGRNREFWEEEKKKTEIGSLEERNN
jgi:hypothetical protein